MNLIDGSTNTRATAARTGPIKVAFVVDDLGYAGAQKQLTILAGALRPDVLPQIHCLSHTLNPYGDVLAEHGIDVHSYRRIPGLNVVRLFQLVRALRRERVDLVHGFLEASSIYAFFAARAVGVPSLVSLRADRMRLTGVRARVLTYCLRNAAGVTVNSRSTQRFVVDCADVPPDRVVVIPNAFPMESIGPPRTPGGPPVVGYVGRFKAHKRIDLLIDAFAIVARHKPDARLVLVGDGVDEPRLRNLARSLGDRAIFTGAVSDVPRRLREFTCLVIMSLSEGLSNAAMESLAAGVPVVAYPTGDLSDIVRDGLTGRLVTDDTPAGLARVLTDVINDNELATAAAENGPRLLREHYGPRKAVQAILPVYRELIEEQGNRT